MFNIVEVFDIAIQVERNGKCFYEAIAAADIFSPAVKDFALSMAAQEEDHAMVFESMRDRIAERTATVSAFNNNTEGARYLELVASGKIFDLDQDPAAMVKKYENLYEIAELAVHFEKESIVFYEGLLDALSSEDDRDSVMGIIRQELKHLQQISEQWEQWRSEDRRENTRKEDLMKRRDARRARRQ